MAIFARRVLQRLIDENASFLSLEHLKLHVDALNSAQWNQQLSFEWEVVVLNALGKVGKIEYEKDFGGTRFPDIFFVSPTDSSFVADIATVSDEGLHKKNPIEDFAEALWKILQKEELPTHCFSFIVGENSGYAYYQTGRVRLRLPERHQFNEEVFGTNEFKIWLKNIREQAEIKRELHIEKNRVDVLFIYDPQGTGLSYIGPAYQQLSAWDYNPKEKERDPKLRNLQANPIYNKLHDKADQLKQCGYNGPKGIILCDGGCELLNAVEARNGDSKLKYIIQKFFKSHSSVDFVATVTIEQVKAPERAKFSMLSTSTFSWTGDIPRLRAQIYQNSYKEVGLSKELISCLENAFDALPNPLWDAENAFFELKRRHRGEWVQSFIGGVSMEDNRIRISASLLLKLLAGQIDHEEFLSFHSLNPTPIGKRQVGNPFDNRLRMGMRLEGIDFDNLVEEDDDWITFNFGGVDPAIAPFVIPQSHPSEPLNLNSIADEDSASQIDDHREYKETT